MTVRCPNCGTEYSLPERLLGDLGARVRCPTCAQSFVVTRAEDDLLRAWREASEAPGEAPREPRGSDEPRAVAHALLDALVEQLGAGLDQARAQGRTLAVFGPDLMRAFDRYRARLGRRGDSEVFRDVLRERWGVDLTPTR